MKKVSKRVSFEKMNKKELTNLKGGANSKGKVAEKTYDGGTLDEVTVQANPSLR